MVDAYLGAMHTYCDSVTCCKRFGETYKQKAEREYEKSDRQLHSILTCFGNEAKAIRVAENRLHSHYQGGAMEPSKMYPATTLHLLVSEIRAKTERDT